MKKLLVFFVIVLSVSGLSGCIVIMPSSEDAQSVEDKSTPALTEVAPTRTLEKDMATPDPAVTPASTPTPVVGPHPMAYYQSLTPSVCQPFVLADWAFCGYSYGTDTATMTAYLGAPSDIETVTWGADGSVHDYHTYDFGRIGYLEGSMNMVSVERSGYPGPRGIEVGDSLESVIKKFCSQVETADASTIIFYRENTGRANSICLPPSGVLYDSGTKALYYDWYNVSEYGVEDMATLEEYAVYTARYSFGMQFDGNDTMTSYTLYYGADAE